MVAHAAEAACLLPQTAIDALFPGCAPAPVFLTHTRPGPFIGTRWPLLSAPVLASINLGGTLDENVMQHVECRTRPIRQHHAPRTGSAHRTGNVWMSPL